MSTDTMVEMQGVKKVFVIDDVETHALSAIELTIRPMAATHSTRNR